MGAGEVTGRPRVSVVTGAGNGIGRAIAFALAAAGDLVACLDLDAARAADTAAQLPGSMSCGLDVRSREQTTEAFDIVIDRLGRIDVAVPCAGIFRRCPAAELPAAGFDDILDVNLFGAFFTAQAAARSMVSSGDGGSIVFVGSTHSVRAMRQQAAYAASKGAIRMLAQVLAVEWARWGIRVNTVGPGFTETAATAPTRADPERLAAMLARVPQRRVGQPEEIAAVVKFLASAEASFVTGAYLNADGGWLAR